MTLLGLYRILEFKGSLSLKTITDKGPNLSSFIPEWEEFLERRFVPNLQRIIEFPKINKPSLFPILKSGPAGGKDVVNSSG